MKSFQNSVEKDRVIIFVDVALYSKEALFKCLYWYGDEYYTEVNIEGDSRYYKVTLKPLGEIQGKDELQRLLEKFQQDLIDFNLRDIVSRETKNIRELLIAKAFSHGEFDEEPPGEITDPVGF